ncbi:MAG: GNAT family N-acetyltransferase [Eubacteriales bacterium]|nr:GNAT family N-acetyltransferase [Eubacteriales bacterium]MDD3881201.1 GNAT family N-acetyltransferase [Eubacteriales bacterium]MDD4511583.1 GNAT family N-acetyltransferase [Eubacteriales bacterium]
MTELRNAGIDDCDFIASIFEGDEYEMYFAENDTTAEEWAERFPHFSGMENKIILENGAPAGWLTMKLCGDKCDIGIIAVRRENVGSGIGYRAFDIAISSLPPEIKTVHLDVQKRNTHAEAFYKRYGFITVGEEMQPVGSGEQPYWNMEYYR